MYIHNHTKTYNPHSYAVTKETTVIKWSAISQINFDTSLHLQDNNKQNESHHTWLHMLWSYSFEIVTKNSTKLYWQLTPMPWLQTLFYSHLQCYYCPDGKLTDTETQFENRCTFTTIQKHTTHILTLWQNKPQS